MRCPARETAIIIGGRIKDQAFHQVEQSQIFEKFYRRPSPSTIALNSPVRVGLLAIARRTRFLHAMAATSLSGATPGEGSGTSALAAR